MNKINILGINITLNSKKDVLEKVELFFNDGNQHQIVTPNPEIILHAHGDEEYFYILNKADIAIPDGMGLKVAGLILKKNIKRIAGSELLKDILEFASEKNKKVVIFNWKKGLSKKDEIIKKLKILYPKLNFIVEDIDREWSLPYYKQVNLFKPEIAIVTLGFPQQDKFVFHELPKMPYMKLGIGVGGSIDYLTGKIKEPPRIFRTLGLEWMWRFFNIFRYTNKTKRLKRIYNAVVVFPWKFFKWRFILPFRYRPNVACLLFKKEGNKYKVLLVERSVEPGHWQLPQGGTDGENTKSAGIRELSEELNCNKFKPIMSYNNLYKYKFGNLVSRASILARQIQGYKGHKQDLFIAEFTGNDEDVKVNFWDHKAWKWVDSERLVEEVHPYRKKGAKIYLEKFNEIIKKYEI